MGLRSPRARSGVDGRFAPERALPPPLPSRSNARHPRALGGAPASFAAPCGRGPRHQMTGELRSEKGGVILAQGAE
jgi:hypothetical protein